MPDNQEITLSRYTLEILEKSQLSVGQLKGRIVELCKSIELLFHEFEKHQETDNIIHKEIKAIVSDIIDKTIKKLESQDAFFEPFAHTSDAKLEAILKALDDKRDCPLAHNSMAMKIEAMDKSFADIKKSIEDALSLKVKLAWKFWTVVAVAVITTVGNILQYILR